MNYITYTPNGRISQSGSCEPEVLHLHKTEGTYVLETTERLRVKDWYVLNGAAVKMPESPSVNHVFNWEAKRWEDPRTLADLKATQWSQIKQARSQAEYAGFTWDGSTFDSDATSQNRITGAVTMAQMSTDFTIGWVLKDNSTRTLNQAEMLQVGAALGQHVAMQFAKGVLLREAIEAATSQAEVEAVVW